MYMLHHNLPLPFLLKSSFLKQFLRSDIDPQIRDRELSSLTIIHVFERTNIVLILRESMIRKKAAVHALPDAHGIDERSVEVEDSSFELR